MKFNTDEKHSSQIPALQLFIQMGYEYLPPRQALEERDNKTSNVILEHILTKKLKEINRINYKGKDYLFSEDNIKSGLEKIKNVPYNNLLSNNQEIYDLITLGTSLKQTIDGNSKSYTLNYIDWKNWENNQFHVTAEYTVERTSFNETIRPDIVLFVNGIPLVVIECKAPKIEVKEGISQMIRNQTDDYIPKLFIYSQLLIATNKNTVKYATTGTQLKFWSVWQEKIFQESEIEPIINTPLTPENKHKLFKETPCFSECQDYFEQLESQGKRLVTTQDLTLYSLCYRQRLLELIYQFTLFDQGIRKIARYQQYFTVKNLLKYIKEYDKNGKRKGGVIWQTQGSGKSLTMVMMAKALVLDPEIINPRIILVTDREALDTQLKDTFANCGLDPKKAKSGRHLIDLIEENKASIITTIINKFASAVNIRNFQDPSDNIFVLVDESHRSQHGQSFHPKMRQVFPNGCYLGFTGTPLMKREKNTFSQFGGLIPGTEYTIDQAVKDGAVVPLVYEGRYTEQEVNKRPLDVWFERYCQGLNEAQKADLKRKYSRISQLNQAEQVIYSRAFDISEHYREFWQNTGFKAQLVAPNKRTALKYKQCLDEFGYVSSEVIISPPDTREGNDDPTQDTDDLIVKFWKQMIARYGSEKNYNEQVINSFKYGNNPEILIVVDKLITGFDAPRNTVLYLTRKLRDHTLLQAIARVNRLYSDDYTKKVKDFGYVIDYEGVLEEIEKALKTYSSWQDFDYNDLKGTLQNIDVEIDKLGQHYANLLDIFKTVDNPQDEEAYKRILSDEQKRDDFYEKLAIFSKTLSIALSSQKFLDKTPPSLITTYKKDLKRFHNLKAAVKLLYSESVDYRDVDPKIRKLLDTHLHASEITQIVAPFNLFDDVSFESALAQQKTDASKADLITSITKRTINEKLEEDPAFYSEFSELINQTIADYHASRISEAEYYQKTQEIREKILHRDQTDIPQDFLTNPDAIAFFGLIKPFITTHENDPQRCQQISEDTTLAILEIINNYCIVDWQNNEDIHKKIMNKIDDFLYDDLGDRKGIKLTPDEMDNLIEQTLLLARRRLGN